MNARALTQSHSRQIDLFGPMCQPIRIGRDLTIYRDKLFAKFKGLLTYGSPLDKFAAIWPPTVALNRDTKVFPKDAIWLNIWDPTDPVSAKLDAFEPERVFDGCNAQRTSISKTENCAALKPINIAYAASPIVFSAISAT